MDTHELERRDLYELGEYVVVELRVGAVLKHPDGREVFFQPGDEAADILDTVDALLSEPPHWQDILAEDLFGPYFD